MPCFKTFCPLKLSDLGQFSTFGAVSKNGGSFDNPRGQVGARGIPGPCTMAGRGLEPLGGQLRTAKQTAKQIRKRKICSRPNGCHGSHQNFEAAIWIYCAPEGRGQVLWFVGRPAPRIDPATPGPQRRPPCPGVSSAPTVLVPTTNRERPTPTGPPVEHTVSSAPCGRMRRGCSA